MKEQRITIEIGADGSLTADAEGFSGETCIKDLERLLEGLASDWQSVERKPEAAERQATTRSKCTIGLGRKR